MLKIINGQVFDPRNKICGKIMDVCIKDGKVVDSLPEGECEILDAKGCVVMPGGVEIHSHVAGTKVNSARSMCPEDHYDHFKIHSEELRAGTGYTVPTTYYTGYEYSQMGYTTLFEAAVPPLEARHAHEELNDIPLLDNGMYVLMGNNHMAMEIMAEKDKHARRSHLNDFVTWLLTSSKGYAVKVVNPGGVESWKWNNGAVDLDTPVPPFGVTPRQIILELAQTVQELKMPHGMHLHANHLGEAGNYKTTLETLATLDGLPVHLTHLQFHSYGATKGGRISSAAKEVADFMNEHPHMTFDVGQLVFGHATTMTSDSPMEHNLFKLTGNKWINCDIEMESGSGIVPMDYKKQTLVNAVQWCIGLELMLMVKNPWQLVLTTDHPNAGPFTAYPQIIKLLMDKDYRNSVIETLNPKVKQYSYLADLDREYTIEEIAIITRSAPAKILGLDNKGHLGSGADGDVAVYKIQKDKEKMFASSPFVVKDGKVVVKDGKAVQTFSGRRLYIDPDASHELLPNLVDDFKKYYSVELGNFAVQDAYIHRPGVIPCK